MYSPKQIFDTYYSLNKKRVDILKNQLNKEMNLLEIGSSSGAFLSQVKEYVKNVVGVEYNNNEVLFCRSELGLEVHNSEINELPYEESSFDVICFFEVFEHTNDPIGFLKNVSKLLKDDGFLIIEVPNLDDIFIRLRIEEYKNFYFRDVHEFYYTKSTLEKVLNHCGFILDDSKNPSIFSLHFYNVLNFFNWFINRNPEQDAANMINDFNKVAEGELKFFEQWLYECNNNFISTLERNFAGDTLFCYAKKDLEFTS